MIQELKPIPQPGSQLPRGPSQSEVVVPYSTCTSFKGNLTSGQPSSPTKSFLTQFPVVKEKFSNSNSNTPTKTRKSDTSPEQLQQVQQKLKQTSGRLQQDYSIFDFSETRNDTSVYDISKTGSGGPVVSKDLTKTEPTRNTPQSSNRWISTKAAVTAAQQVPVSSTAVKQSPVASYSNKMTSFPVSYSHPVPVCQSSMKAVTTHSYPSYNISSTSGNPGGTSSGNVAPLPSSSSYQKSAASSMTR